MSPERRRPGIGFRREVAVVLPIVLLLLVVLSAYTLLSYRAGIASLVDARRAEAARLVGRIAESIASGRVQDVMALRERAPTADYFALISDSGHAVFEGGAIPTGSPLSGFDLQAVDGPAAIGPRRESGHISAIAPTSFGAQRHYLRIDLRAHELARQQQSLRALTWVVIPINAALSVLVLLFLRHLLAPYDKLLATARMIRRDEESPEDEVAFLISSFERAVRTLEEDRPAEGDLETLELAFGPSLESGFLLLGHGGDVLSLNPAGAALLGSDNPPAGRPVGELLARHAELDRLITAALEGEEPIQRQEVSIERDEQSLTLGLSVHPLRRDDGKVRGYLVLFADLTETRRQAEEERLSVSLAQVGELAAGVAHEMRNSLSTFRGYLTLVERAPDEEVITDYLSELRRETDHLQRVVEDFLSFARPESSRPETFNLETVIRRAAADPALGNNPVEITGQIDQPIQGDAQLLERAIRNLLHNAVEAQASATVEGPISVRLSTKDATAIVEILDRGAGIPRDVRERLFEPFVTGRADGVGLGLSLARRIVDLHGGQLQLEDRSGGGTSARLSFGLAEA
ncbi:MAG: PAS domain-containing sensor histidine kinase [Thermoanaerobaculia bacterium]